MPASAYPCPLCIEPVDTVAYYSADEVRENDYYPGGEIGVS